VFGHRYGTPVPDHPAGMDVLLEIDVQGAAQVREHDPEAVVLLVLPPSRHVQRERLLGRGDDDRSVVGRLAEADREEEAGRALADHVVVNDDLSRAVDEAAAIVEAHRIERHRQR
jgi:guanylate kinase